MPSLQDAFKKAGIDQVVVCPYCDKPAHVVDGNTLYWGHMPELSHKLFWRCNGCDAHVGCHDGTRQPLGRLANAELRKMKMAAHAAFDPIWKSNADFTTRQTDRKNAYKWLAAELGIPAKECHIGMFDEKMCQRVIDVVKARNGG